MYVGWALFDVVLPEHVSSLKDKRSFVRPLVAALRKFDVSVAEVGSLELWRRAEVGVSVVAADAGHVRSVLDGCERLVAERPELELLSARTHIGSSEDD